jgi:uncharacterized membrane protein
MTASWPIYAFLLGQVVLTGVFLQFLPRWTRQDLFFAITVAQDFRATPPGRAILRGYWTEIGLHTLVAAVAIAAGFGVGRLEIAMAGVFWQVAGIFAAFLRARRRVMPHAAPVGTVREAQVSLRDARSEVPLFLRLSLPLPLVALGALALYLGRAWDRIPDRFPTHWNLTGVPDRWADKSPESVFSGLLLSASVGGVMWLAAWATLRWSRRIHAAGLAAAQEDRFRIAVATCLLLSSVLIVAISAWAALLPLRPDGAGPPSTIGLLAGVGIFMVAIVVLLVRNRPGRVPPAPGAPVGDRTEDRFWKAGLFYVNADDPALLIEKRFGIGYTLNLGHPWAWMLLTLLLGAPWLILVVLRRL